MKKNEIKIGSTYTAKITNRVVPVRIDEENPHGGWDATNMTTGREVRIKSAAKLRGPYRDGAKADPATSGVPKVVPTTPTTKTPRANTATTPANVKPKASTEAKPAKNATRANDATKTAKATKPKRLSGLDLAAKVLADANEPLQAKAIAERAIAAGWKTNGKTPAATLYAAMTREITRKGKDARFKKVDRGLFVATRKGA